MSMPAILLAAGASRRLGRPKQLVRVGDETLLGRTIRVVGEAGAGPILLVLGAHAEIIAAGVDLSPVQTVLNPDWEQGIASSIRAGIEALRRCEPEAASAMLLVCDQPRLIAEHLRLLIEVHESAGEPTIVASEYTGVTGIPAIFPASQFGNLLALRGDAGAKGMLRNPECRLIPVHFEGGEVDIDTTSDLDENLAL
jgi:molybdenum cofactor cytidylyltransferase